jgi:hypothetical protein
MIYLNNDRKQNWQGLAMKHAASYHFSAKTACVRALLTPFLAAATEHLRAHLFGFSLGIFQDFLILFLSFGATGQLIKGCRNASVGEPSSAPPLARREKKGILPSPSPTTLRHLAQPEPDNPKASCPTFGGKQRVFAKKQARVWQILLRHK